jgi:hypothetical protein
VTDPIRPVGLRPPVPGAVEPVGRSRAVHGRDPDADPREEREERHPPRDGGPDDDAPGTDGHVDVLA